MERMIYFVFSFLFLSSAKMAKAVNNPVVDTNGQAVQSRTFYWMLGGTGGGVNMGSIRNQSSCETNVFQEKDGASKGMVVTILPAKGKKSAVQVSSDIVLQFYPVFSAGKVAWSYVWQVAPYEAKSKQYFVNACAVQGSPMVSKVGSRFRLDKSGDGYVLRFCSPYCRGCKQSCSGVGVYDDNGVKRLALSINPLTFKFQYAPIMF